MSPIIIQRTSGGDVYATPFVGPVDHTAQIDAAITALSNVEIDANGYLKPGLPISRSGTKLGTPSTSTPAAFVAKAGNTGLGTVGTVSGASEAPSETITLTCLTPGPTGTFSVVGSVSGYIGTATVGTAFTSTVINFTIADGTPDFIAGDAFTSVVAGGTSNNLFGVTVEATKVAASNAAADIAAAGVQAIVVATIAQVLRAAAEDNLGRPYTATEVAGFVGTTIVLL